MSIQCDKYCGTYSDVDVYMKNGDYHSLCTKHAWELPYEDIDQVIPQHGGDNINRLVK